MQLTTLIAALSAAGITTALPSVAPRAEDAQDVNPFLGKNYFANSYYAGELNQTVDAFLARNDSLNAARTRTVQKTGSFVWVTSVAGLSNIKTTIDEARAEQRRTRKPQIVQLVLYDLPDRDCSGGQSGGEFTSANGGLELYKKTFVDPYAAALKAAWDLTFAVIVEPDSLGNLITNQNVPFCANASSTYEQGIAYVIAKLQAPNIAFTSSRPTKPHFNHQLAADEFAKVVAMAQNMTGTRGGAKIRGFSTDVSNYNPYIADPRANYTEYSNSYDELHYADSLAPYLTNNSLPAHFIIDQGRSGLQNTRDTWGDWCNVRAGFGIPPTTNTNSSLVDSIVWAKPGGESDGACGPTINGVLAPNAGLWWESYVEALVVNADPPLAPTYTKRW
ncbi:1,4-beta-D-glucan cellobiohydrolase CEL6B [Lachnellula suecica]|uniref:Glucanase n=1 Tax=Lachnellula suecica TaxID=602035 RepID=A0A8T9C7Q7_9HELO|nr:1,4-beta-D-glucan cellobiohydrolase CEL6B [Lachnellula suecica]